MFLSPSKPVVGKSSVIIRKPMEEVFRFIGEDFFENYPKWSPEVKDLKALSDGPVKVGTRGKASPGRLRAPFGVRFPGAGVSTKPALRLRRDRPCGRRFAYECLSVRL